MSAFSLLGKCSWEALPGRGEGASQIGCFRNRPVLPELLLMWAEMHFYIKKTATRNCQRGHFWAAWLRSQPEVLGGVPVGEEGAFPPDLALSGPIGPSWELAEGGARTASALTGRRGPGR